jgi:hypothetical protein
MDTKDVVKDPELTSKFQNPHILDWEEDKQDDRRNSVMIFGDPITSREIKPPLPFDKTLATRLSLNIPFSANRTECQAIASATRSWRLLTDEDVRIILKEIKELEAEDAEVAVDDTVVEALEKSRAKKQGFLLNSKLRKALDDYAMKAATRYFRSKGYDVEDHHKDHPYDLGCTKKNEKLFVEVKGTQTNGESIILTSGEVEFARRQKGQMALFVLHSIKVSADGEVLSNGEKTVILPWDVDEGRLKPISYWYEP